MSDRHGETNPVTTCLLCGGRMQQTLGELTFTRGNLRVTVSDVPMEVCEACGERYVPGPLGVRLSAFVDQVVREVEMTTRESMVADAGELRFHARRELAGAWS